jgi:hypothetical protein
MINNYYVKMLIGFSIFSFVMGFIHLSSGLSDNSDRVGTPIGGLFSAVGFFAAITAGAIRSINLRLDQAGIPADPQFPTSNNLETARNSEQRDSATSN